MFLLNVPIQCVSSFVYHFCNLCFVFVFVILSCLFFAAICVIFSVFLSLSHTVLRVTCGYLTLRHLGAILSHQADDSRTLDAGLLCSLIAHIFEAKHYKNIQKFEEITKRILTTHF